VASRAAIEEVVAGFRRAGANAPHRDLLTNLVQAANARVCETELLAGPAGSGMASTIVVCGLRFDRATVTHLGDSRLYVIRKGEARQITHDHTVAGEQAQLGILSTKAAGEVPTRHVLTRSLGKGLFAQVEINEVQLIPGDVVLLCSDGLHGPVSAAELAQTVSQNHSLERAARELLASANEQDGSDNVSVQLIRIRDVERMGMYRGRPYKLR
jgi:PPM family protein phosphatase